MSQENVEVVATSWDLWLRRDFDGWLDMIDPDVEWDISAYPLPDWPDRGKGRQEWFRHLSAYLEAWIDHTQEVQELIDAGDDVVVVVRETARMRDSGATLDRNVNFVFTVPDGRVVRFRVFLTRDEALEAVGLREGDSLKGE
jgi:ketosteroid isomerase-like protein